MYNSDELEKRIALAFKNFEAGYNCSQSVFMAYADIYGITPELAAKLASSFGGGMGKLREVCGAVTGMFLTLGLHYPATDVNNKEAKATNYDAVQRTAKIFKDKMGTYNCGELLSIQEQLINSTPDEQCNNSKTLHTCKNYVAFAAEIVGREVL
ncbi:MAG: C-GCAxxG-C-C family protein [bacterium]